MGYAHPTKGMGQGKGSLLIHTRDYVTREYGPQAWETLVDGAPEADQSVLRDLWLRGGWYPIGAINRVVDRLCHDHGRGSPDDEMRKLSAYIADSDLGSVYKMVLRMGSAAFLVKRTGSLWNRYFDVGDLRPSQLGERHWQLTLRMAYGEDAAPNELFCGPGCPSWIEMGLRLTGAEHARVEHVECRKHNRDSCVYEVTW